MPASNTKVKVVILWEDEIRIAAKAMERLAEVQDSDPSEEVLRDAFNQAMKACYSALRGADEDGTCLVLSRKPMRDFIVQASA